MTNFLKKIDWKKCLFSFYWLLALLIVLDQGTKALFLHLEATQGPNFQVEVIKNFFYFSYYRNTGAAWSILEGYPWLLALVSFIAATLMMAYRIVRRNKLTPLYKALWAMVIAGTIGNLIDRAFYKALTGEAGVVDFLHFRFGNYDFPVFNVADMCLVIGLISMIVLLLIEDFTPKNKVAVIKDSSEGETDDESK